MLFILLETSSVQ